MATRNAVKLGAQFSTTLHFVARNSKFPTKLGMCSEVTLTGLHRELHSCLNDLLKFAWNWNTRLISCGIYERLAHEIWYPNVTKLSNLPYKSRYPISVKAQFNRDNIRDGGGPIPALPVPSSAVLPSVFRLQRPCDGILLHPRRPTACQQIHYLTAEFSANF